MTREASLEWLSPDTTPERADKLARDCAVPADEFAFHPIGEAVGNTQNDGAFIIKRTDNLVV